MKCPAGSWRNLRGSQLTRHRPGGVDLWCRPITLLAPGQVLPGTRSDLAAGRPAEWLSGSAYLSGDGLWVRIRKLQRHVHRITFIQILMQVN